ncbi:tetratricopeptide repeat protein [Planktosalinus lacus]|uniref:Tetratricopeptide repeat protein n=1 Tax=Planktosalinus lacus TaxID=1526573 RepID=A0A8J2YBL7_9FLAO|nr:hypothetical protein [Planktosalinus lacus]GGD99997.1 hypothetical protein GCM10011312_24340 [Planktosalinus lacus]
MKKTFLILFLINIYFCFGQDYFEGKNLYCGSSNPEALKAFNAGIELLHLNSSLDKKTLNKTADVFFKAFKIDSTFCDAAFFTGYTMRLMNDKDALVFYYMADSLAQNKASVFKSNLAAEAMRFGNVEGLKLARKKYEELMEYFPENPEGYYGIALTSPMIGDLKNGLNCINTAISKYLKMNHKVNDDVYFLKGVLLTLNEKYEEGIKYLEKAKSTFKNDENFKIHYSLCLLKISQMNNDLKMRKKAKKIFNKIKNKNEIPEFIRQQLIF